MVLKDFMRAPADDSSMLIPRRLARSTKRFYKPNQHRDWRCRNNGSYKATLERSIVTAKQSLLRKSNGDLLCDDNVADEHELRMMCEYFEGGGVKTILASSTKSFASSLS